MIKAKIKKNFPTLIYLLTLYVTYEILNFVIHIFTNNEILMIAKASPFTFIIFFGIFYFFYIIFGVGLLYAGHIISKQDGNYDLSLLILSVLAGFTTLTTLILKFSGAALPKELVSITFFIILTNIALSTTSKLLQLRKKKAEKNA